jgi:hypothetical protein
MNPGEIAQTSNTDVVMLRLTLIKLQVSAQTFYQCMNVFMRLVEA